MDLSGQATVMLQVLIIGADGGDQDEREHGDLKHLGTKCLISQGFQKKDAQVSVAKRKRSKCYGIPKGRKSSSQMWVL
jgi:hypothetical protein